MQISEPIANVDPTLKSLLANHKLGVFYTHCRILEAWKYLDAGGPTQGLFVRVVCYDISLVHFQLNGLSNVTTRVC